MERPPMKSKSRRFEVLLPARYNDGNEIPPELIRGGVNEIVRQFDAVSFYEDAAQGIWRHEDTLYRDNLGLVVVDIPDTPQNRKWMKAYKARWKERLKQL